MQDFLAVPSAEPVVDFLEQEEKRRNPPMLCVCNHALMVHAEKDLEDGIWTHQQGRCHMTGCECKKAVPVV